MGARIVLSPEATKALLGKEFELLPTQKESLQQKLNKPDQSWYRKAYDAVKETMTQGLVLLGFMSPRTKEEAASAAAMNFLALGSAITFATAERALVRAGADLRKISAVKPKLVEDLSKLIAKYGEEHPMITEVVNTVAKHFPRTGPTISKTIYSGVKIGVKSITFQLMDGGMRVFLPGKMLPFSPVRLKAIAAGENITEFAPLAKDLKPSELATLIRDFRKAAQEWLRAAGSL